MTHRWQAIARHGVRVALCLATMGALAGCAGDDTTTTAVAPDSGPDAVADGMPDDAAGNGADSPVSLPGSDAGHPTATFVPALLDFGATGCGTTAAAQTVAITASGSAPLTVSATTTGSAFTVSPTSLSLAGGGTGTLTVTASVLGSAIAGASLTGSLNLFTNDPNNTSVAIPLSVIPTGATLALAAGGPATVSFPTTEVGSPAPPVQFQLLNVGNASGTFAFSPPTPAIFALPVASPAYAIEAGGTLTLSADFTPTSTALASATSAVTSTTPVCGQSLASISFSGQGAAGVVTGYPTAAIDFGPAPCGGPAPARQSFALTNSGSVTAHITVATLSGAAGFTTSAAVGRYIMPNGGVLAITVSAPAVPSSSSLTPLTATLTLQTDADTAPQTVTLIEEPNGAVLAFDTSQAASFGDFGSVAILSSASQSFSVANTGNAPADVTLAVAPSGADAGSSPPFAIASPQVSVAPNGTQADSLVFVPSSANPVNASLSLNTTSPVCGALPAPLLLSGVGSGGGPVVSPLSLDFLATCGGPAPAAQTFAVLNAGTTDLSWALGPVIGPGAASYTVTTTIPPGLLLPGEGSVVTVLATAVPSPAPNADPQSFAASVTVTTDVPLDPPHVVSLGVTPLGDQLSFVEPQLRFGQVPIATSLSEPVAVTNQANAGSPAATFSLALEGAGAASYTAVPALASNVPPAGGSSPPMNVVFTPPQADPYPASLAVVTSDSICTALPTPIPITGTGTRGMVSVSTTSIAFGSSASDPLGMVDCGATGQTHTFSVTNIGNQELHITGLALGQGAASPYVVSGVTLPALLPISGGVTVTVTPKAIPSDVPDPNDPSPFADTLTLTTDAALDAPHPISLVMQARGAVIVESPVASAWSFGTIGFGSIGTITTAITNTGNAPASMELTGVAQPSIFGIRNDPTTIAANGTSSIVGQFVPASANGSWSDNGTLTIDGEAFCQPLPANWNNPTVALSGASNDNPAILVAGSLAFPTSDCGAGAPAGQSITLTNATNVPYRYSLALQSGAFYAITDPGPGTLPAGGTVAVVVTPQAVVPGPGIRPGQGPYEDELLVSVATTPPSSFDVPIAWTLNGAVLSLPRGAGPNSDSLGAYYPADSSGGLTLPMQNSGTTAASVAFSFLPAGALVSSPATPLSILPGISAAPGLVSTSAAATCPSTTNATVTFFYAGPVCQPFPLASVNVRACAGSFP